MIICLSYFFKKNITVDGYMMQKEVWKKLQQDKLAQIFNMFTNLKAAYWIKKGKDKNITDTDIRNNETWEIMQKIIRSTSISWQRVYVQAPLTFSNLIII